MDLSKMNLGELSLLQSKFNVIRCAGDALFKGGMEPTFSLTGEASVIAVEPILSFGPVADVVLFEVDVEFPAPEPVRVSTPVEREINYIGERLMSMFGAQKPADVTASAVLEPDAAPLAHIPAPVTEAAAPKDQTLVEVLGYVSGPVTDAEKRQIEDLHKQGIGQADIAKRLNRRVNIVASHLYYLSKRQAKDATKAPVVEAEAVARKAVVSLAGQAADQRAEATEIQKPGGDQGGLQQLHAEHDPVQSGVVGGPLPVTAPDEAAPVLHGELKRIFDHVKSLGFPKGWDADLDLEMCEAFGRGTKTDQIALDLDVDSKVIRDRYTALTACIRNDRGHMSMEGQGRLASVLRERLKNLRAGAKAA